MRQYDYNGLTTDRSTLFGYRRRCRSGAPNRLFLKEGAKVTVVSPEVTAKIAEWAADNQLVWQKAAYDESVDLAADFVLLATSDSELNAMCAKKARAWGLGKPGG